MNCLRNSPDMPSELVVDVHSVIGLVQQRLGLVDRSIRSLLRALWLQEKVTSESIHVAITEHRLGLVFAKAGDFRKAVHLIEKALSGYNEAKMKADHVCIQEAEQSLKDFRLRRVERELERKTPSSTSLTDIYEEEPIAAI